MHKFLNLKEHVEEMPRATSPLWARRLREFLKSKEGFVSEYTLRKYRREIGGTLEMLADAGLEADPKKIGEKEVQYLLKMWRMKGHHPNYIKWKLNHLGLILTFYRNDILKRLKLPLQEVERTHVRWLGEMEVERIWAAAESLGPQYEIRIHLGLDLLLRKVEMYRLKVSDFTRFGNGHGKIRVLGKGRMGGKEAIIPFHPDTDYYLTRYLEWREEQFARAEKSGLPIEEEARDAFLIWFRRDWGLGREHYTTMDNRLAKIAELARVRFSYHDLRRTGAKFYWLQGWPLVAIQHLLRHAKIETTIRYLGLKYDIVEEALWNRGARSPHNSQPLTTGNRISSIMRI